MAARLKVFAWSDGFHAFTVATPSKPKALAAWGMGQDIFKSGLARQIDDGPAYDAALAAPGTVVQTGEAVDVGSLQETRVKPKVSATSAQKARVVALERELESLDTKQAEDATALEAEIDALTTRRDAMVVDQQGEREDLVGRLKAARKAL